MDKRKIILVDKTSILRDALKNMLLSIGNAEIIAEASSGNEFIELLENNDPDIVFIDTNIENMNGLEATKLALKKQPRLTIIGFSATDTQCYIDQMIEAGAKGFLSKNKNNYDLLCEILAHPEKGNFFSPDVGFNSKLAS